MFTEPAEFWSSPLHRWLYAVIASDADLVRLAGHTRAGPVPSFGTSTAVRVG